MAAELYKDWDKVTRATGTRLLFKMLTRTVYVIINVYNSYVTNKLTLELFVLNGVIVVVGL